MLKDKMFICGKMQIQVMNIYQLLEQVVEVQFLALENGHMLTEKAEIMEKTDKPDGGGSGGLGKNGGWYHRGTTGKGGVGTSYSGGAGGGGIDEGTGQDGSSVGGAGGSRRGAGNPGPSGANGTGGTIIIYTNKLLNKNIIEAKGIKGHYDGDSGSGGSSGGGTINIFYPGVQEK